MSRTPFLNKYEREAKASLRQLQSKRPQRFMLNPEWMAKAPPYPDTPDEPWLARGQQQIAAVMGVSVRQLREYVNEFAAFRDILRVDERGR